MTPEGIVCTYKVVIMSISSKGSRATRAELKPPRHKLAPEFLPFKNIVRVGVSASEFNPRSLRLRSGFLGSPECVGHPPSPAFTLSGWREICIEGIPVAIIIECLHSSGTESFPSLQCRYEFSTYRPKLLAMGAPPVVGDRNHGLVSRYEYQMAARVTSHMKVLPQIQSAWLYLR